MKNSTLFLLLILATGISSNLFGQVSSPVVSGDKNLRDDNVRMRSVELDRTKSDAEKNVAASNSAVTTAAINTEIDKKFPEINEDFEGIQKEQDLIIKAYTTGEKVNFKQILSSAEAVNSRAKRLDANLFEPAKQEKSDPLKKDEKEKPKSVKELIVELDTAIGEFVQSPMFQNLRVIDPQLALKTKINLEKITHLSENLAKEAGKMN